MSLSDNTTALRNILAAVGELPAQASVKLQEKSVEPTTSVQTVVPDSGYDGMSKVTVGAASGGAEVKTATGSITTSSSGTATVNCGFKPDLVIFHIANFTTDGESYESVIALPFEASKSSNGNNMFNCAAENSTFSSFIACWPESITNTGVSVGFYRYSSSPGYVSNKTYNWTAIKYTA